MSMSQAAHGVGVYQPLSLKDICLDILNKYRHALGDCRAQRSCSRLAMQLLRLQLALVSGDLGHLEPDSVRRILGGVTSATQLAGIEDATRYSSNCSSCVTGDSQGMK
jgi:hypothetical protein